MLLKSIGQQREKQLSRLVHRFDREAQRCADARAYYAACALQGAVLEGLLILMCNCYLDEVRLYLQSIPVKQRPGGQLLRWDLDNLIRIAVALDWLPARKTRRGPWKIGNWVQLVRELRNLVHPGRHVRTSPDTRLKKINYSNCYEIVRVASDFMLARVTRGLTAEIEKRERRKKKSVA